MVEDFKVLIKEYLHLTYPEKNSEEIAIMIPSLWSQYIAKKTPGFDSWLKATQKSINSLRMEILQELARRNSEGTQEAIYLFVYHIITNERILTLRHDKTPLMYYYNKDIGIYEKQGETKIKMFIEKVIDKAYKTTLAREIVERIRIKTYVDQETISKIEDPYKIVCGNGVINLATFQIEPFSPEPKQFQRIPTNYNPDAQCPKFIKFIEEILPDKEKRDTVQEYIGYGLFRQNIYEKCVLFYGSGSNGKTILLSVIKAVFGKENVSAVKPQTLANGKDQYATADLETSLFNIAGEISDADIKDSSVLKESASPEMMRARNPYEAAKNIEPYAKQIWSANKLPKIYDQSDGFWRRMIPIEFNSKYVEIEQKEAIVATMPEHLKNRVYEKNVNLLAELTSIEELEGVLVWALKGLQRLFSNGTFSYNEPPQVLRMNYTKKSDSVKAFFEEIVTHAIDSGTHITKKDLFNAYNTYCGYLGVTPASETKFSLYCKKVENLWEERKTDNQNGVYSQPWCWIGISGKLVDARLAGVCKGSTLAEVVQVHTDKGLQLEKPLQVVQNPCKGSDNELESMLEKAKQFIQKNRKNNAWMLERNLGKENLDYWVKVGALEKINDDTYYF